MLDIKDVRENITKYKDYLGRKNAAGSLDELLKLDEERRTLLQESDDLRALLNSVNKKIGLLKKSGESADGPISEMKEISQKIKELSPKIQECEEKVNSILLATPNIPHESVPVGGEDQNALVRSWGNINESTFKVKPHWEIAEDLDIVDFKRGAKISGSGYIIFKGAGARLERALINFFIDTHLNEHGFEELSTPFLVSRKTMTGTGQLPKMENDMYKVAEDDLFLIPTAEVPVTNIYSNEILVHNQLPIKKCAYSPCFRREAGSYGKDTRGMVRIHQFDKVEMVAWVKKEKSYEFLEELTGYAENILKKLNLSYRVLNLATNDLSFASAKTYDLEVWSPGTDSWLEVSSVSNFEDFQARRAKIRYRPEQGGKTDFVHTLNGSGLALPRIFIAILENYQQEDGSVSIPEVLRPYMGNKSIITKDGLV